MIALLLLHLQLFPFFSLSIKEMFCVCRLRRTMDGRWRQLQRIPGTPDGGRPCCRMETLNHRRRSLSRDPILGKRSTPILTEGITQIPAKGSAGPLCCCVIFQSFIKKLSSSSTSYYQQLHQTVVYMIYPIFKLFTLFLYCIIYFIIMINFVFLCLFCQRVQY